MSKRKHDKNDILDSLDEDHYSPEKKQRVTKIKKPKLEVKDKLKKPVRTNLKDIWNE